MNISSLQYFIIVRLKPNTILGLLGINPGLDIDIFFFTVKDGEGFLVKLGGQFSSFEVFFFWVEILPSIGLFFLISPSLLPGIYWRAIISEVQPLHLRVPGWGGEGRRQVLQRRGDQQDGLHPRQWAGPGQDDHGDARDQRMVSDIHIFI